MWDGHDGMGWWMVWGGFLWIAIIGTGVFFAAWLSRNNGRERTDNPQETPLDIARRRYAAGEISREQFEQIRRDLGH